MTIEKRPHAAVALAFAPTLNLSLLVPSFAHADDRDKDKDNIKHVLLISVDGMHAVDLQRYVNRHPTSTVASQLEHGVRYTNAQTSPPSNSFPGADFHDRRHAEDARRVLRRLL